MKEAIVTWRWGSAFTAAHVNAWARNLRAWLRRDVPLICVTDDPSGITEAQCLPMLDWPGYKPPHRPDCWRRLRHFDPDWAPADRCLLIDLDALAVGDITPLLDGPEPFRIMLGSPSGAGGLVNPYNGSVWRVDRGMRPGVWSTLDPRSLDAMRDPRTGRGYHGSDQAWMAAILPDAPTWSPADGLVQARVCGDRPPEHATLLAYAGLGGPWRCTVSHREQSRAWQCYADGIREPSPEPAERALIVGYGDVWDDLREALDGWRLLPTTRVYALPETAQMMRGSVDAIPLTFHAARIDAERRNLPTIIVGHDMR